ncbi:formate dehydrogenase accessory sulfurtransferase FdhD [Thermus scotoductus]|uniref:Sulfurtransferase FdhD n=1 Tax=Thermus scotoductus TaxID=37636 RepID=A0A430VJV1_THESC|nr:formate dehydrogenase accessory sulfurtransferase FdhD [Thermus scotoductus]RTG97503.1 sulfurtransferase FdhD [Thermus scotoductus]RTH01214.1 sulfurtransferase FdhD [Thermus scotoductus]RTH17102.1 sulfurtransferase FdhD [Thermus scotoductus]RTH98029.1 sulfurtransferase FdhD [Thermus scotoductus]RTI19760.1 sulfurtransferase FdhD [Thermus scotoductus]
MWRFEGGCFQEEAYSLPEKERFLLLVNGKPWASFSYTPGDEVYLALGHLFLSGVLGGAVAGGRRGGGRGPTRGIHGAALFDLSGQLLYLNEDIGRHNAVDRLAGYMLLEGVRPPVLLAVTGRVSQEMAAKAIGTGAVLLASRTGATAPAVSLAQRYGLALAAYVRPTGYRLYAPGGMPVPEGVLRP